MRHGICMASDIKITSDMGGVNSFLSFSRRTDQRPRATRQYCTRRIHKLRKTAGFLQGKKKFVKKEVEPENASSVRLVVTSKRADSSWLIPVLVSSVHIVLFQAERCWSQFMLLKRDSASEARKKHHAIRKLKKAAQYAATLNDICQHLVQEKRAIDSAKKQKSVLDERAALETSAYAATMKGFVAFEQQDWADAANSLSEARSIYEGLAKSASSQREELLMQAGMDSIDPNLKYSLYNLRGSGKDEDVGNLLDMLSGSGGQNEMVQSKVQSLLSQKLSEKAHEMSSIEFRKQQIPVRNEKLVQAILRATEAEKLLENAGSNSNSDEADEKLLKTYESVLAAWWEAQTLAEGDLREDELATAKVKSSKSNETTGQLKAVLSYVAFCRIMRTVDRDMVLMRGLERRLKANETLGTQPGGDGEGRKKKRQFKKGASASHLSGTARREDLVSLWDTVVQVG